MLLLLSKGKKRIPESEEGTDVGERIPGECSAFACDHMCV